MQGPPGAAGIPGTPGSVGFPGREVNSDRFTYQYDMNENFPRVKKVIAVTQVFQVRSKSFWIVILFLSIHLGTPGTGYAGERGQKGEPVRTIVTLDENFYEKNNLGIIGSLRTTNNNRSSRQLQLCPIINSWCSWSKSS